MMSFILALTMGAANAYYVDYTTNKEKEEVIVIENSHGKKWEYKVTKEDKKLSQEELASKVFNEYNKR